MYCVKVAPVHIFAQNLSISLQTHLGDQRSADPGTQNS